MVWLKLAWEESFVFNGVTGVDNEWTRSGLTSGPRAISHQSHFVGLGQWWLEMLFDEKGALGRFWQHAIVAG